MERQPFYLEKHQLQISGWRFSSVVLFKDIFLSVGIAYFILFASFCDVIKNIVANMA